MKYAAGVAVTIAVALAAACGGSTSGGNAAQTGDGGGGGSSSGASSSGGTQDSGPSSGGDAGDGSTQPPPPDDGPWPAPHYAIPLMQNLGGTPLAAPKIVTVTFVGDANRDALRAFDDSFAEGTPWWAAVSPGYGVGAATSGGWAELPDTVSGTTIDDDQGEIQQDLANWLTAGQLPAPDANTIYVLYFPASTTINFQGGQSCSSFGGYHSAAAFQNGTLVAQYAVIPNCAAQDPTQTMPLYQDTVSHEVIEAATDPHPGQPAWYGFNNAWFRVPGSTVGQGEVADACERYAPWVDGSGNQLSRSWSNDAVNAGRDPCQPQQPGELFYSLAVPTVTQPSGMAGVPDSDGYIVVKRGASQTVDAVFFSEAKLPSDAQIQVGARAKGGTFSSTIGTGITTTFTPAAAHNGMHVSITFAADSTASPKDYRVSARASLSATDYHDWPIILRVQ